MSCAPRSPVEVVVPRLSMLCLLGLLLVGCHHSGTWQDDEGNWGRAFGRIRPSDAVVVHSAYWRSPHFTLEFQYFFHVRANAALRQQLFGENTLKPLAGVERETAFKHFFGAKPAWSLPGPPDRYTVWVFATEPGRNFRAFEDRRTGDLFPNDFCV